MKNHVEVALALTITSPVFLALAHKLRTFISIIVPIKSYHISHNHRPNPTHPTLLPPKRIPRNKEIRILKRDNAIHIQKMTIHKRIR